MRCASSNLTLVSPNFSFVPLSLLVSAVTTSDVVKKAAILTISSGLWAPKANNGGAKK